MPLAKEKFAEYQRLRRSAKYPGMGCGEVGGATERYKASAAAAEIRCCKEMPSGSHRRPAAGQAGPLDCHCNPGTAPGRDT